MKVFQSILRKAEEIIPGNFIEHYVRSKLVKAPKLPYSARNYFESKYKAFLHKEFSDRVMIWPDFDPLFTRYHYNSVENGIIEYFSASRFIKNPSVLDIGSGAGHWIDFYLVLFEAADVVGLEISKTCADALRQKYQGRQKVHILEGDIASPDQGFGRKFDIINAIGIMFHIVDDALWCNAISNMAAHLNEDGVMVIGGQFGLITHNVAFTPIDKFASWGEFTNSRTDVALIKKRVRSLRHWQRCAHKYGLSIAKIHRTKRQRRIKNPENHLLFLTRSKSL